MKFKTREEIQKDVEGQIEALDARNKHSDKHDEFRGTTEARQRKCDELRPQRLRKRRGVYQVAPEDAAHMDESYLYILETPRRSSTDGYSWLCARFYSISDESGKMSALDRGQRPSLRQFRDYVKRNCVPDKWLTRVYGVQTRTTMHEATFQTETHMGDRAGSALADCENVMRAKSGANQDEDPAVTENTRQSGGHKKILKSRRRTQCRKI